MKAHLSVLQTRARPVVQSVITALAAEGMSRPTPPPAEMGLGLQGSGVRVMGLGVGLRVAMRFLFLVFTVGLGILFIGFGCPFNRFAGSLLYTGFMVAQGFACSSRDLHEC